MTMSNEIDQVQQIEAFDQLVTPEFAALADFSGFRAYEAVAVQETGAEIVPLIGDIAAATVSYLRRRPETDGLLGGERSAVDEAGIKQWLERTIKGPFDGDFSAYLREVTHLPGGMSTFPGVHAALPPQLTLALMAWVQGKVLDALGGTCDIATISAAGGAWMNQFMLQLGIMLEPHLVAPDAPMGKHDSAEFHPYAEFAGYGEKEARVLRKSGPLLEPAGGGVVAVAYDYLLSRPESAGYFQDPGHLAMRKQTLKGWWSRSTTQPMDGKFCKYMSRVADSHVQGGGRMAHVVIPADLTIALMGWVEMRVMTALNTVAPDGEGGYTFGQLPEPPDAAAIGTAWMRMLTLQLGILLKPYLPATRGA